MIREYAREALPFKLLILFNMFSLRFLCLANWLMSPYTGKPCFCLTGKYFSNSEPVVRDSRDVLSRAVNSPEDLLLLEPPVGSAC